MTGWFARRRAMKRRKRTILIARKVAGAIRDNGTVIMSEDQFFDINQVKEVIDVLSQSGNGISIRANVFQSQVVFHAESTWNHY